MMPVTFKELSDFCLLANREIFKFCGSRATCIFSTATVCDVLNHFGIKSKPLRVTAGVFPNERDRCACVLGSGGDGTRQPATEPDMWKGHLVSLVEDQFIVDTTLDQANDDHPYLHVGPCVIYLPDTQWGKVMSAPRRFMDRSSLAFPRRYRPILEVLIDRTGGNWPVILGRPAKRNRRTLDQSFGAFESIIGLRGDEITWTCHVTCERNE